VLGPRPAGGVIKKRKKGRLVREGVLLGEQTEVAEKSGEGAHGPGGSQARGRRGQEKKFGDWGPTTYFFLRRARDLNLG